MSAFFSCLCHHLLPLSHTHTHSFPDEELSKAELTTEEIKAQGSLTNYSLILTLRCLHESLWSERDQFLF